MATLRAGVEPRPARLALQSAVLQSVVLLLSLALPSFGAAQQASGTAAGASPWVATWGAAMMAADAGRAPDVSGQTLRLIVHASVGGPKARVWLSNRFGAGPLHIGAAHLAICANADGAAGAIRSGSDRALTFDGLGSVTIPPGATIVSDAAALDVPPFADLAVSLYFPDRTLAATVHDGARQVSYAANGNAAGAPEMPGDSWTEHSWYVLTGVDVYAPGDAAVVALGDSITDGNHSTESANRRWPDDLAVRLEADASTHAAGVLGVVNAGISGNRVLLDGTGPNAMARFDADVLDRSGVRYLILFEGINDIEDVTHQHQTYGDLDKRLEWALAQMAQLAHEHGIKVFGATQMPDCRRLHCASVEGEATRQALNEWIRTDPIFDGVIDFDRITRDPAHPSQLLPKYDSGDSVHPNDLGYEAMADAIDLSLFTAARINGKPVATLWHPPFRARSDEALHPKANFVEIDVSNLWANRLIGDSQPGAKRYAATKIVTYTSNSPLLPSGLLTRPKVYAVRMLDIRAAAPAK
ncbi:MAG: SGNH/GDSL hydrolase family protein [Terracidiphilus sp.]